MGNQLDNNLQRRTENGSHYSSSNIMARMSSQIKSAVKSGNKVLPNESYEPDAESSNLGSIRQQSLVIDDKMDKANSSNKK